MTAVFFSAWVTGRMMKPLANTRNTEISPSLWDAERD